jgi:DNA repair photolyase
VETNQLFELRRRTFDTPNFRGIEFIETEAKSILNKVPGNNLPFNWTLNPYRGCSHACSYCMEGSTPVLMADGRTRAIKDLRVGDAIYGTEQEDKYKKYVRTTVLDHWSVEKPAFRVVLEDGTELISSGDHRYLSNRGWKYVHGAEQGPLQRPFLTTNNSLLGPGRSPTEPIHDEDYRRGYLCGMIRGDGNLAKYSYERKGRQHGDVYRFRLALALQDKEGLLRTKHFLDLEGVTTKDFVFSEAEGPHAQMDAIRAQSQVSFRRISSLIEWPRVRSRSWSKGFFAGIFDAEGSRSRGILRIPNCDVEIIDNITGSLDALGYPYVIEKLKLPEDRKPMQCVRVLGGLKAQLPLLIETDPAITRKRDFEGACMKNSLRRRVVAVEDLGMTLPLYDITTGTGDFIANGVVSHNCFARSTHTYMDMNAGKDFETKIVVKVNAPELLRKELRAKRWLGESVAMGTATDPYQRAEGKYKLMPRIIETFIDYRNPFSILTKGTLILRDLDLLVEARQYVDVSTAFSIGTLDEDVWRKSEPGTPHPRKRIEAVRKLNEAGIPCGVLVAPVLPGISDGKDQLREVITAASDAGATNISPILLHLRPIVRDVYMEWLKEAYPDLVVSYEEMYPKSYASKQHRSALTNKVRDIMRSLPPRKRPIPRDRRRESLANARREKARLANEQLSLL